MNQSVGLESGEVASGPVTAEILAWLQQALDEGRTELDAAARHLDVSSRTLRRRLQGEGRTFQGLLDDVRRERALSLLTEGTLPIGDVSRVLGFTRITSFYRAFRRWTQTTPAAYRSQQRDEVGVSIQSAPSANASEDSFHPPSTVLSNGGDGVVPSSGFAGPSNESATLPV